MVKASGLKTLRVMPDAVQHEMLLCWSGIHMWDIGPGPALHHFVLQSIRGDKHNNQIDSLIQLTIWLFGIAPTFWAIT